MSTKFAVEVDGNLIEVAHRSNRQIVWLNPIAKLLKSNIKVIPVDNSHQGIYNIGDIKKYNKNKLDNI